MNLRDVSAVVTLVLALVVGAFAYVQVQHNKELKATNALLSQKVETETTRRKAAESSLNTRFLAAQKASAEKGKRDDTTVKALKANPDWSGQRIPDDVIDALGM